MRQSRFLTQEPRFEVSELAACLSEWVCLQMGMGRIYETAPSTLKKHTKAKPYGDTLEGEKLTSV